MGIKFKRFTALCTAAVLTVTAFTGCGNKKETAFEPKLDTETAINLHIAGFFENFEALDQVIANFNEYYPNITTTYEQTGNQYEAEFLQNNPLIDIFMTDNSNIYEPIPDKDTLDYCADLNEIVDQNQYVDGLLNYCTIDGELLRVPMGEVMYGMAVNTTLLKNEGLSVPTNYSEFLDVLQKLKDKGYTPIQGSSQIVYSYLVANEILDTLATDSDLLQKVTNGDESAVEQLTPAFEKINAILDNGYTDADLNASYPDDNYDGAILNFFEGNVPFWICNTEHFSGMKKRESKSEAFSANPFEYEFNYIPTGEKGAYAYTEAWYGFSVNKNSENYDYAMEFVRFLATAEQINTLASVKGVPSSIKNSDDPRYVSTQNAKNQQQSYINDGTIKNYIPKELFEITKQYASNPSVSASDIASQFIQRCHQSASSIENP